MGYHSDSSSDGGDWHDLVASLSQLADAYPPYTAGTLPLPDSDFDLYYKDSEGEAHVINLVSASADQLEALMQACQPASFGRGGEDILDESYRKAGKLDATSFATTIVPERTDLAQIIPDFLLEGEENKTVVEMELYKLNIYGKGSFFKAHVDTPRSERMLGSLVIVLPTPHRGGELVLRPQQDAAYTFDSGNLLAPGEARIGYAAFFSDVAHEVLPVTDGHRITLTYNLYAKDMNVRAATPVTASELIAQCSDELSRVLQDENLLPDGGLLLFGLRHAYPVTTTLAVIANTWAALKGVDRLLWNMLRQMNLYPEMHLFYEFDRFSRVQNLDARGLISEAADFYRMREEETAEHVLKRTGTLATEGIRRRDVVWVTPVNKLTRIEHAHTTYGNEAETDYVYADLCLIARVQPYRSRARSLASGSDNVDDME